MSEATIQELYAEATRLTKERDAARAVARLAVTAWYCYQQANHPAHSGYDEEELQALSADHPWLKESNAKP